MNSVSEFCVEESTSTLCLRKDAAKTAQASLPGFLAPPAPREVAPLPRGARTLSVVSMFSGCGGMDLGFLGGLEIFGHHYPRLPFEIIWANDLNETACRTYQHNLGHHIHCGDVWDVIDTLPRAADVLIGGFPCQDISVNGKRQGVQGARSGLYKAMVEAIGRVKPKIFVAENVKGLLMKHSQDSLRQVLTDFQGLGYQVNYHLYRAADYGVPQTRERVFFVGTARGVRPFTPPRPERSPANWMTAAEAIADLEELESCPDFNHVWSLANVSPEQGNRRLAASRPAHTIRAECHGNIQFHYRLPRRISMREAARFQTFPDSFIFQAKLRETERQVGNAVPPVLAWHIARAVAACFAIEETGKPTSSKKVSLTASSPAQAYPLGAATL